MSATIMDFDAFFRSEYPAMVALARGICGDRSVAEDLAQEAFTKAHQHWQKISSYDRPGTWLRRVTINLALSTQRRKRRELALLRRKARERADPPCTNDPDAAIWHAVSRLPPRQRAVVALFYQEDRSTREIAEILNCTISTATSHLSEARARLARELGNSTTPSPIQPRSTQAEST